MAQSVERILGKDEVISSILISSSKIPDLTVWDFCYYVISSAVFLQQILTEHIRLYSSDRLNFPECHCAIHVPVRKERKTCSQYSGQVTVIP